MKISKIEVENFRSIKHYDFELKSSVFFVGQNNHGKTNLFEALSWFNSGKSQDADYHMQDKAKIIKVRIHYCDVQKGIGEMVEGNHKTSIQNQIAEADEVIVEKTSRNDKRAMIVNGENKGNPSGFDAALNYFLPKIEYVTTKNRLTDVSSYKLKSPIAEMLSGVLVEVVQQDPKYKEFQKIFDELFNTTSVFRKAVSVIESSVKTYLQKQFAEGAEVYFRINDPKINDMLKGFETEVDDGIKTKAENKGDGMQRAIMLAIIQAYADYRKANNIARNFVFLIDEAELHLHPSAQRSLKIALKDIVENGGQVLVNTHSSIFINEIDEDQLIYSVNKKDGVSELLPINNPQETLNSIYAMLGNSPNDLLFPRNFLIVEGKSEFEFLTAIIKRFYTDRGAIQIIYAEGDHDQIRRSMDSINKLLIPLFPVYKEKLVLLLDKPHPEKKKGFERFKEAHNALTDNKQFFILDCQSLEEYYPDPWKSRGGDKVELAKEVGQSITKEQFEGEMGIVHKALERCWELSYE